MKIAFKISFKNNPLKDCSFWFEESIPDKESVHHLLWLIRECKMEIEKIEFDKIVELKEQEFSL